MQPLFNKAAILGLGLIGGSLGMALVRGELASGVLGYDVDNKALETGIEVGAINRAVYDPREAVKDADLVVLAGPVGVIPELARSVAGCLKPGCLVTDVGSTKGWIVDQLERVLPPHVEYVGGHPMTGSEKTGVGAADCYFFENTVYVVATTPRTPHSGKRRLVELIEGLRARPVFLEPEAHDRIVASVSHLPHLLAVALVNTVGIINEDLPQTLGLAAGGFRDTTRVAAGDPTMWRDIFLDNGPALLQSLRSLRDVLDQAEQQVAAGNGEALFEGLVKAQQIRRQVPARVKGLWPALYEVLITVPDKPGVIGFLGQLLGDNNINICDLEILRVREGEGGTMRLAFQSHDDADRAMALLKQEGILARRY